MTAVVKTLPVWKKGATAAERLYELARWAEDNPDLIECFVLLYQSVQTDKDGSRDLGRTEVGFRYNSEVISLLEVSKAYYVREIIS